MTGLNLAKAYHNDNVKIICFDSNLHTMGI